ncbi:MAG TPA: hypothetical protein VGJ63_07375 [Micromonosporaceae bacterium]
MHRLLDEARRMPPASLSLARGVPDVWPPEHLVNLREMVRKHYRGDLGTLHTTLKERLPDAGAQLGVYLAAGEMALMEAVGRSVLPAEDRRALRRLWDTLLHAR